MKTNQPQQSDGPSPGAVAKPLKIFAGANCGPFRVPEQIYQALEEFALTVWRLAKMKFVSVEQGVFAGTKKPSDSLECSLVGPGGQKYRIAIHKASPPFYVEDGHPFVFCFSIFGVSGLPDVRAWADDYHNWRLLVLKMLSFEGFEDYTCADIYQWHRRRGLESKLFCSASAEDVEEDFFEASDGPPAGPFRDGALCFLNRQNLLDITTSLEAYNDPRGRSYHCPKPGADDILAKIRALLEKIERSKTLSALLDQTPLLGGRRLARRPIFHADAIWFREPLVHVADKNCGLGVFLDKSALEICHEAACSLRVAKKSEGPSSLDNISMFLMLTEAEVRHGSRRLSSLLEQLEKMEQEKSPTKS